jgi:hypothetical protein
MLQGAGSGSQRKCHAGFVDEFIECAQFMIPLIELVEVNVSSGNDSIFQRPQDEDGGGLQIRIEIDDQHFMGGHLTGQL